jgi:hypothetical protein
MIRERHDTQHNDTQHKGLIREIQLDTQHNNTLS